MIVENAYIVLGVDETSTDEEIKSAFRKLSMSHHPDKGGDSETFDKIKKAYISIKTFELRESYKLQVKYGGKESYDKLIKFFSHLIVNGESLRKIERELVKLNDLVNRNISEINSSLSKVDTSFDHLKDSVPSEVIKESVKIKRESLISELNHQVEAQFDIENKLSYFKDNFKMDDVKDEVESWVIRSNGMFKSM